MSTRGERNNNPGNLRHGSNWLGLAAEQPDPDFCTFTDPKYGIRALAKVLLVYGAKGFDTIRTIVGRWAPESENNTKAYVAAVEADMKCDPDTHLDVRDYAQLYPLAHALMRHENGRVVYSRAVIDAGLAMAGVVP